MKIGIFGGSFNPIHNAHVDIARYILDKLKLDKMIIIPVGKPSHKSLKMVDSLLRLKMCQKAFEMDKNIIVSDIEIKNPKTSYTIDTLHELLPLYGEHNEYYEIIGEDSANSLNTWKDYTEILKLSKVVVFRRGNYKNTISYNNLIYLDTPLYDISSTMIREKIKNGEDVSKYVPEKVLEIIKQYNLYK